VWRDNREASQHLTWERLPEFVQILRDHGLNDLACAVACIAAAKRDFAFCIVRFPQTALKQKVWQGFKIELPALLDLLSVLFAHIEMEGGASQRQAAERAAALFGGHYSFYARAQDIRVKLRGGRMLQKALELLRRHPARRKDDDTLARSAAELNLKALNQRRICW
jgi:hypothetical protein